MTLDGLRLGELQRPQPAVFVELEIVPHAVAGNVQRVFQPSTTELSIRVKAEPRAGGKSAAGELERLIEHRSGKLAARMKGDALSTATPNLTDRHGAFDRAVLERA